MMSLALNKRLLLDAVLLGKPPAFVPSNLFRLGAQGAWYDPSDILLDWRYNLLTYSEQFDNAAWTKTNSTVSANAATAPDGTLTADQVTLNTASDDRITYGLSPAVAGVSGVNYTFSFWARSVSGTQTWSYRVWTGTGYSATQTVTLTTTWTRYSFAYNATGGDMFLVPGTNLGATVGTSPTAYLWGADIRLTSNASKSPTYQKITDGAQDYFSYTPQPTMFQESSATTFVTAVEQGVGLILDKSKGLALGAELVTSYASGGAYGNYNSMSLAGTTLTGANPAQNGYSTNRFTVAAGNLYKVQLPAAIVPNSGTWSIAVFWSADGTNFGGTIKTVAISSTLFYFVPPATAISCEVTIQRTVSGGTETAGPFTSISVQQILGNHASQGTSAARPTLRARYNLLTYSEQFDNGDWATTFLPITPNTAVAPDGTTTADTATRSSTSSSENAARRSAVGMVNATSYTFSVYAKANTAGARLYMRNLAVDSGTSNGCVQFNLENGTIDLTYGSIYAGNATITAVGNGWYRCAIVGTTLNPIVNNLLDIGVTNGVTSVGGTAGDAIYIWGADLRATNDGVGLPVYQRIAAATDYDTTGFPPYLAFDGADDKLATSAIDFTGTDEMTVFAGVRKISDASTFGTIVGISPDVNSNNGSFLILASPSGSAGYSFYSRGTITIPSVVSPGYAAPINNILTQSADISAPLNRGRINGAQAIINDVDSQGTGNYGNYALSVGNGVGGNPFNGRIYSVIALGRTATAGEIQNTESWINRKAKVY